MRERIGTRDDLEQAIGEDNFDKLLSSSSLFNKKCPICDRSFARHSGNACRLLTGEYWPVENLLKGFKLDTIIAFIFPK
jgi:hypothetical protein